MKRQESTRPGAVMRQQGVATVEFAIAAPLLALLVLTGAELGRAFMHYTVLSYATREGVRYISDNAINADTGVIVLTGANITAAQNQTVYGNPTGAGDPRLPSFGTADVSVTAVGADNVQVVANYTYQPLVGAQLPTFGIAGSIPLAFGMQISITMRAIN